MRQIRNMQTALHIKGRTFGILDAQHATHADKRESVKKIFFFRRGIRVFLPDIVNISENSG